MHFIDECTVFVSGGHGGKGCIAFRREKYVPRGGPSGGDGGNGGSVVLVGEEGLLTLLDQRYQKRYCAEAGEHGMGSDMYGKAGPDWEVKVPLGTLVTDADTGVVLCDVTTHGQRFVAARGGTGGRGNIHFATSTNQTPREAEPGLPGQQRTLQLTLKLLADVGLLGFPNVGKSTFISSVSRAKPKIADYPFTTLHAHLGVVSLSGGRSFVLADIPGLIEGAAEGHGLGHRFLKHVERTRVLLHLIELSPVEIEEERNPLKDFEVINGELRRYDADLQQRPQIVALSKIDLTETQAAYPILKQQFADRGIELHALSAVTGQGVGAVLEACWKFVATRPHALGSEKPEALSVVDKAAIPVES